jgi:DNA-binding LacI/PurR family transcriptional regulator
MMRDNGVTAFVCTNDQSGYGCLSVLEKLNVAVPGDVSVTGFDFDMSSVNAFSSTVRQITTVDPNFIEMGRNAVRMAMQRITQPGGAPLRLCSVATFVPGDTVGPVRE